MRTSRRGRASGPGRVAAGVTSVRHRRRGLAMRVPLVCAVVAATAIVAVGPSAAGPAPRHGDRTASTVPEQGPTGYLRVASYRWAVATQISVDGHIADSWALTWLKIAEGSHTVCFSAVFEHATAPCQTVVVAAGETTTVTPEFAPRANLHVITSPAVDSQISVNGVPRNNWGLWTDLPDGSYEVCFGPVAGYTAPPCQTVDLADPFPVEITGTFVASGGTALANVGELRVTTSPALPTEITVDGEIASRWGLDWLQIPPGSHQVCFSHVEGYTEPACSTATVVTGAVTEVQGAFTRRGFLQVETSPAVAATVFLDGNPADDWGLHTDVPVGSHEVCFGALATPTPPPTPPCQNVVVTAGGLTSVVADYGS